MVCKSKLDKAIIHPVTNKQQYKVIEFRMDWFIRLPTFEGLGATFRCW